MVLLFVQKNNHIIIYEVGTATMMAAVSYPAVYEVMAEVGQHLIQMPI